MTLPSTLDELERLSQADADFKFCNGFDLIDLDIAARNALPSLIADSRELALARERIAELEATDAANKNAKQI